MKKLFILLTLFTLTANVHARSPDDDNTAGSDLSAPDAFENTRLHPSPDDFKRPYFLKLLEIIDDDQDIITIQAQLTTQQITPALV